MTKRVIQITDRTADRIARIRGDVPVLPVESKVVPEETEPVKATARQGGLGPAQLEWLRANVHGFSTMERQAVESERHRAELREKAGLR